MPAELTKDSDTMMKRLVLAALLALPMISVANRMSDPFPGCFPCPDKPPAALVSVAADAR